MRGFHSIYRPWLAVEAIVHLKNEFANLTLVMSGGNKHDGSQEKTELFIKNNAIEEYVKITGFIVRPSLEDYLIHSDILLNMPIIDNTPVSVIQAMACGLCIVSTNVGGLPYLIEDEIDGLLIPPNNSKAMAKAVRRILTEPGLAPKLSANARAKAEQFDWSIMLPKWEEIFERVVQYA
jgi:glycosyltransferase involved in cell wall biosynthesis